MKRALLILAIFTTPLLLANEKNQSDNSAWQSLWDRMVYQYELTVDYWTPIVQPTASRTVEYWAPIVKETKDTTVEYWAPKVKATKDTTVEYWRPHLKKWYANSMEFFADHILPKIRSSYAAYMAGPGEQIAENFGISLDWASRHSKEYLAVADSYYKTRYPITYYYVADVPAFVKQGYEQMILMTWKFLASLEEEKLKDIPESSKASLGMAMAASMALENRQDTEENKRLNRLLNDIRPYVRDYGMQDCYIVTTFRGDIMNAFNLGCNIFVAAEMIEILQNDDRLLRAVIAHEVAHGDRGHGLKTMGTLVKTGVSHFAQLTMEELVWMATGEVHETFGQVANGASNGEMIMEKFSPTAPAIEIDADVHAAEILENAGYSKQDLIDALKHLHAVSNSLDCDKERLEGSGSRDYPTFCARRDAILAGKAH